MEYRLTQRIMKGHDFYEGIRAVLVDKDQKPVWNPSTLAQVRDSDIAKYFDILTIQHDGTPELELFSNTNYTEYPHRRTSLPFENDIARALAKSQVIDFLIFVVLIYLLFFNSQKKKKKKKK